MSMDPPVSGVYTSDMDARGTPPVWPWEVPFESRYAPKDPTNYTEFERRYPPDQSGEEVADNARVWKIYRDRMTERDQAMIDGWNKTLDILLIFAGLFSAVSTAFIVESYKSLQPDYTAYVARAYFASIASQNNSSSSGPIALKDPDDFIVPSKARWTNGLWFVSLIFSLLVALLAILAKQWLEEYSWRMRTHFASPRHWAWRHLIFSRGLKSDHLETFFSTLPVMLHGSLFLFLFGLVLFLWSLDPIVAGLILGITCVALLLYFGATLAPFWIVTFPTATPLLRQGYALFHAAIGAIWRLRHADAEYIAPLAPFEAITLQFNEAQMDAQVISTMISALPAHEDVCVALQAMGSLDPRAHPVPSTGESTSGTNDELGHAAASLHTSWIKAMVQTYFERFVENSFEPSDVARWLRTAAFVETECTIASWRTDQWMSCRTHDVRLLSALQLHPKDSIVTVTEPPGSHRDSTGGPDRPAFLASSLLVLVSRRIESMTLHNCTALFVLVAPYVTAVSTDERMRYTAAIDLLLQRIEDISYSSGAVAAARLPIPYSNMSQPHVSAAIRALNVFGLLFSLEPTFAEDLGWTQPFSPALCAALFMMNRGEYKVDWQDYCRALAFVVTPAFSTYAWPEVCLNTVIETFANAYFRPKEASSLPPDLPTRILHATLVQCRERVVPHTLGEGGTLSILELAIKSLLRRRSRFQLQDCGIHAAMLAQAESVDAAVHRRLLGWLHPYDLYAADGTATSMSIWALIRDTTSLDWPLVLEAVTQLCILHRSDVDTRHMFVQLLRGGQDGPDRIGLIAHLDLGEDGSLEMFEADVKIAQHAKEVSPEWWAEAAAEMRAMSAPRSQSTDAKFKTLAEFADHVDEIGPCPHCPRGVVFAIPRVESPVSSVQELAIPIEDEETGEHGTSIMMWALKTRRRVRGNQQSIV